MFPFTPQNMLFPLTSKNIISNYKTNCYFHRFSGFHLAKKMPSEESHPTWYCNWLITLSPLSGFTPFMIGWPRVLEPNDLWGGSLFLPIWCDSSYVFWHLYNSYQLQYMTICWHLSHININIYTGWWLQLLWKMMEFVSRDNEIPNTWKAIKFHGSKLPTRYIVIPIINHY